MTERLMEYIKAGATVTIMPLEAIRESGSFGGVLVGASANSGGHVSVNRKITAQELEESGDGAGLVARTAEELAKLATAAMGG